MGKYALGNVVRVTAAFTDPNNSDAATDPTNVYFSYRSPDGQTTHLTYGVDAAVVKDSVGNYHCNVNADLAGQWRYRWFSTGTGQAAEEGDFYVSPLKTI